MFPWTVTMPTSLPGSVFQDDYGSSLRTLPSVAHPAVHGHLPQRGWAWRQGHLGLEARPQEAKGGNTT